MNDEFLYRLRKQPPELFATRLRAALQAQAVARARTRATFRAVFLAILVGGPAVAIAFWMGGNSPGGRAGASQESSAQTVATRDTQGRATGGGVSARASRAPSDTSRRDNRSAPVQRALASSETHVPDAEPSVHGVAPGRPTMPAGDGAFAMQRARAPVLIGASSALAYELVRVALGRNQAEQELKSLSEPETFRRLCEARLDIALTTSQMTHAQLRACNDREIRNIATAVLGHYALVLTAAKTANAVRLSPQDLFLALAKSVPDPSMPGKLVENPHRTWRDLNPRLEPHTITIFGPPPESTLALAIAELVLEPGCARYDWIEALRASDPPRYREICRTLRDDVAYVPIEESEYFITQRLWADPNAFALLSFNLFAAHRELLNVSLLEGAAATIETVASGEYSLARPLRIYVDADRLSRNLQLRWRVDTLLYPWSIGPQSTLYWQGMVPVPAADQPVRLMVVDPQ